MCTGDNVPTTELRYKDTSSKDTSSKDTSRCVLEIMYRRRSSGMLVLVGLFCLMIGLFCLMIGLFCLIIGLFCLMIGLFSDNVLTKQLRYARACWVGLFCQITGLFCQITGLFCHITGLFCHMGRSLMAKETCNLAKET